jgi:hypothetical protein
VPLEERRALRGGQVRREVEQLLELALSFGVEHPGG